jgi:nicotinamidase/pyrazinamidase
MSLGTLLIIDPQVDFHGGGSLAVPGADEDSARIAGLIDSFGPEISEIIVTLDTHFPMHIAHSCFWTSGVSRENPPPFEVITREKIESRTWIPVVPSLMVSCIFSRLTDKNF